MTTSTTATRAAAHFAQAAQTAEDQLRSARQLALGLARLPHLIAAAEYFGKAWGVADLMAATCAARDVRVWTARRTSALDGCRTANSAIIELVRVEVAA